MPSLVSVANSGAFACVLTISNALRMAMQGVMCPRSEVRSVWEPICWFSVALSPTIAGLPDLVAPAVTHHRTPASWHRCLALGVIGALWPDQRHVRVTQDAQRSRLVAPLLALGLPTLGSSGMPLSVLGIATSWLSGQLTPWSFRRRAQLPRADAVLQMLHCRSRFS